jgi:hypothetical protein
MAQGTREARRASGHHGHVHPSAAQTSVILILTIFVPAAITLRSIDHPREPVAVALNASPLGYTQSLTLFAVPVVVLGLWFLWHPFYRLQRRAFWLTMGVLIPTGILLDVLRANAFFRFPNRRAVVGVWVPVVGGGTVPVEEFLFYALGFVAVLLSYIWCDEYWLAAYKVPDRVDPARTPDRAIRFHWPSLAIGAAACGAAILYKKLLSGSPEGFPGYFIFLALTAVIPSMFLYPTAAPCINARALSFTFFLLLLVSLMWEATLAIPYQWWDYNPRQMIGMFIPPWCRLPIEAALVWSVVSYATVIWYEAMKVILAMEGRLVERLFGAARGVSRGDR